MQPKPPVLLGGAPPGRRAQRNLDRSARGCEARTKAGIEDRLAQLAVEQPGWRGECGHVDGRLAAPEFRLTYPRFNSLSIAK